MSGDHYLFEYFVFSEIFDVFVVIVYPFPAVEVFIGNRLMLSLSEVENFITII